MAVRLKSKYGATAQWAASSYILDVGESGAERAVDGAVREKLGDGVSLWPALPYAGAGGQVDALSTAVDVVALGPGRMAAYSSGYGTATRTGNGPGGVPAWQFPVTDNSAISAELRPPAWHSMHLDVDWSCATVGQMVWQLRYGWHTFGDVIPTVGADFTVTALNTVINALTRHRLQWDLPVVPAKTLNAVLYRWKSFPEDTQVTSPADFRRLLMTKAPVLDPTCRARSAKMVDKLLAGTNATWVHVGDSTSNDVSELLVRAGIRHGQLSGASVVVHPWVHTAATGVAGGNWDTPVTAYVGSGAHTLTIWNASIAGWDSNRTRLDFPLLAPGVTTSPDFVSVNLGFNESVTQATFQTAYSTLIGTIEAQWPVASSPLVCIIQPPDPNNSNQTWRRTVILGLASAYNFGTVDLWTLWGGASPISAWYLSGAGQVHPNTVGSDHSGGQIFTSMVG